MEENSNKMEDVVITAGSFEAGEKSPRRFVNPGRNCYHRQF
jgi:hypothetical protein